MKRALIEIEYKGTNYCGWQIQPNAVSIQQILQEKISHILNQNITLVSTGRTDSGVHALSQFAHFDFEGNFDIKKLPFALQSILPDDISVKNAYIVENNFHARFCVKTKTYYYRLYISKVKCPLKDDFCLHIKNELNIEKMKIASLYLIGEHDFSAFCLSRKIENENNIRTIKSIKIESKNNEVIFKICGTGFLHNMVRIIVGTLIEVGSGKINAEQVKEILESKDRTKAGKTISARGLILVKVDYGKQLENAILY